MARPVARKDPHGTRSTICDGEIELPVARVLPFREVDNPVIIAARPVEHLGPARGERIVVYAGDDRLLPPVSEVEVLKRSARGVLSACRREPQIDYPTVCRT